MIKNKDRSGWFGASDTKYIMGNWETATFMEWWQTKLGVKNNSFKNIYTIAGSNIEHRLADYYSEYYGVKIRKDRQVKKRKHRLRVNLDCETKDTIIEIKTHKQNKNWKVPKEYVWQVQVQMFATKKHKAVIYAYEMHEDDYNNFYLPIVYERVKEIPIAYDELWIKNEYLPRLVYLAGCLKKRKTPKIKEMEENKK